MSGNGGRQGAQIGHQALVAGMQAQVKRKGFAAVKGTAALAARELGSTRTTVARVRDHHSPVVRVRYHGDRLVLLLVLLLLMLLLLVHLHVVLLIRHNRIRGDNRRLVASRIRHYRSTVRRTTATGVCTVCSAMHLTVVLI